MAIHPTVWSHVLSDPENSPCTLPYTVSIDGSSFQGTHKALVTRPQTPALLMPD